MELSLDDLDNPDSVEKAKDFINRISNQPKVTVDITGSETLFASIDAELHLKKHDTNRLLVFQSQCLSAINYLERLLIDYPIESEVIDSEKVSKLSRKYTFLLNDIKGRIELFKNKDQTSAENPKITLPSVSNHLQLTNKEVSYRHYSEVFFKLMKAKNPSIMLNEIIEGGFRYISEDILDFIDKYIHEQRRFIVDLKQANPQSEPENIGVPGITSDIEKATFIRNLFTSKSSFISDKLSNIIIEMQEDITPQQAQAKQSITNNNFDLFVNEVTTLEIRTFEAYLIPVGYIKVSDYIFDRLGMPNTHKKSNFLDLGHYNQKDSDYEFKIKQLQQAAITELLRLSTSQISLQLKRLNEWADKYKRFWKWYHEIYNPFLEGNLRFIDFALELESFFNIPKYEEARISQNFIHDLHDAAMFKHNYLGGFINQINRIVSANEPDENQTKFSGIKTNFNALQLDFIFNELIKLKHVRKDDKINFLSAFKEDELPKDWKTIIWFGSRPKHYSLFQILTGQHEPSLRNKYFVHESNIPFDSNDKPRTRHHVISSIINKAKKI